ncbi:hypothetical protein KCP76_07180 [Salmonella enterica subsp. enterica serovar Weltevreden]|nr:hypothetical protein KCP76_07180 [Salmonella enterica subsp. enterica serovar Weltevreden]
MNSHEDFAALTALRGDSIKNRHFAVNERKWDENQQTEKIQKRLRKKMGSLISPIDVNHTNSRSVEEKTEIAG